MKIVMATYVDRMTVELDELRTRMNKLKAFIDSASYRELDSVRKALLADQYFHMSKYEATLGARVNMEMGTDYDL